MLGLPFAAEKSVEGAPAVIFLGVESDMSMAHINGSVTLKVRPDRIAKLTSCIHEILLQDCFPAGQAAHIAGKLNFVTSWSFAKFGRAAMQPIHRGYAAGRRFLIRPHTHEHSTVGVWGEESSGNTQVQ